MSLPRFVYERLSSIKDDFLSFSNSIKNKFYGIKHTVNDWCRQIGSFIYFDNNQAFQAIDTTTINEQSIRDVININLPNTDQIIVDYIANFCHQNGFLSPSATHTIIFLASKDIAVTVRKRFDFIKNIDGSLTYIERITIDSYTDIAEDSDKIEQFGKNGRPIAITVTVSTIRVKNKKIEHKFFSDQILLVDKACQWNDKKRNLKKLFDENDGGIIETRFDEPTKHIEAGLDNEIALRVLNNQVQSLSKSSDPEVATHTPVEIIKIEDSAHGTSPLSPLEETQFLAEKKKKKEFKSHIYTTLDLDGPLGLGEFVYFNGKRRASPQTKILDFIEDNCQNTNPTALDYIKNNAQLTVVGAIPVIAGAAVTVGTFITGATATASAVTGGVVIGAGLAATGAAVGATVGAIIGEPDIEPVIVEVGRNHFPDEPKEEANTLVKIHQNTDSYIREHSTISTRNESDIEPIIVVEDDPNHFPDEPKEEVETLEKTHQNIREHSSIFTRNEIEGQHQAAGLDDDVDDVVEFLRTKLDFFAAPFDENRKTFEAWAKAQKNKSQRQIISLSKGLHSVLQAEDEKKYFAQTLIGSNKGIENYLRAGDATQIKWLLKHTPKLTKLLRENMENPIIDQWLDRPNRGNPIKSKICHH
jgi:hypothetical protein